MRVFVGDPNERIATCSLLRVTEVKCVLRRPAALVPRLAMAFHRGYAKPGIAPGTSLYLDVEYLLLLLEKGSRPNKHRYKVRSVDDNRRGGP